jgi:penicillin G amidase
VTLDHPLGGPFNIPPAFGAFPPPLADLPGIPTDGGFETVDASTHDARADATGEFGFGGGPANRYVSEPRAPGDIRAESSLPGGTSGVPGTPFYVNLLPSWLTNDSFALEQGAPA